MRSASLCEADGVNPDRPGLRAHRLRINSRFAYDEWLTEDVDDVAIRFLPGLVERRHVDRSTVPRAQYSPADWHGRLGGGARADAMVDRLARGAVRIDLGDVNVRKLLSQKKATA